MGHFPPGIQKDLGGTDGIGSDEATLDQLMRIALHEQAVFVGAWLRLVTVYHDVARPHSRRAKPPLNPSWETSPAAAEHGCVFDHRTHLSRAHLEDLANCLVAFVTTRRGVAGQSMAIWNTETRGDNCGYSFGHFASRCHGPDHDSFPAVLGVSASAAAAASASSR